MEIFPQEPRRHGTKSTNQSSQNATPPAKSAGFDAVFAKLAASAALKAIWRSVYEEEYLEAADPFSFVTMTELSSFAEMRKCLAKEHILCAHFGIDQISESQGSGEKIWS